MRPGRATQASNGVTARRSRPLAMAHMTDLVGAALEASRRRRPRYIERAAPAGLDIGSEGGPGPHRRTWRMPPERDRTWNAGAGPGTAQRRRPPSSGSMVLAKRKRPQPYASLDTLGRRSEDFAGAGAL
jgi:hypothetical protein